MHQRVREARSQRRARPRRGPHGASSALRSARAHPRSVLVGLWVVQAYLAELPPVASVRAFAGDDLEVAVVPPAAQAVLNRYDQHVEHFEVVRCD